MGGGIRAQRLLQWILKDYSHICKTFDTQEKLDALIDSWVADTANLTDEEFNRGILWCHRHQKYLPSYALFLEKAKGLIDPDIAYELVLRGEYKNAEIYYAVKNISDWPRLTDAYGVRKERFLASYKDICQKTMEGKRFNTLDYQVFVKEGYINDFMDWESRSMSQNIYSPFYTNEMKRCNNNSVFANPRATVLLIEDDWITARVIKDFLNDLNCIVYLSSDIYTAIPLYKKVDLILLDIGLPKIDGLEICKRIRKDPKHKDMPIIGMTALTLELEQKAKDAGLTVLYQKPLLQPDLEKILNQYLTNEK